LVKIKFNLKSYQLSVISYQLSVISYQLSVISYQLSVISYAHACLWQVVGYWNLPVCHFGIWSLDLVIEVWLDG